MRHIHTNFLTFFWHPEKHNHRKKSANECVCDDDDYYDKENFSHVNQHYLFMYVERVRDRQRRTEEKTQM